MKLTEMLRGRQRDQVSWEDKHPRGSTEQEHISGERWIENVQEVAISSITANPYQPRTEFKESGLSELAESIQEHGVLHPVVVRRREDGYELIVGERRLRACGMLGWKTIPAVVRDLTDRAAAEMALIENLQRRDLAFFEEAVGCKNLLDEFELTQEELAQRLGKSQSAVANKLRLLKLPEEVRAIISREIVSERHARALLQLEDETQQLELVREIVNKKLNVKQTENIIRNLKKKKTQQPEKKQRRESIKEVQVFTTSMKKLTKTLEKSGLEVEMSEEDREDLYTVIVQIKKPERGEQTDGEDHQYR